MNYNPSTIARVADINRGIIVQTGTCNNTAVLKATAVPIFTVRGRVRILSLDIEAITAFSNDATLVKWQFDSSVPAVATADISAASLTVAQIAAGRRIVFQGTALNTAQVIAANPCISLQAPNTMDVGCQDGVGTLDTHGAVAQTSGTCKITICYVPISEGAYVESLF